MEKTFKERKNSLNSVLIEDKQQYYLYDYYNGCILTIEEKVYNDIKRYIEDPTATASEVVRKLDEYGMISGNREKIMVDNLSKDIAYLSFAPVYQCNFRCKYCFAEYGYQYRGEKKAFTREGALEILNKFFFELFPKARRYRIDFVSGGEPLLGYQIIKDVILYTEKMCKQNGKKVSIWLCTNGSLLTEEICEFLDEHNVAIGVSLDGDESSNDKNRIMIDGKGTYKIVAKKIREIQENNNLSANFKKIWGLCTASNDNCDFVSIIEHFKKLKIEHAQIRLIRGKEKYDIDSIMRKYTELKEYLLRSFKEKKYQNLYMILNDNDQFGKVLKRIILNKILVRRCNAGINKVTICPDGEIYPCDSFVGIKEFQIGHIKNNDLKNEKFRQALINNRKACENCKFNLLCGSDCYYNAYVNTGNMLEFDKEFCIIQKHLIKLAIVLRYEIETYDENEYERFVKRLEMRDIYGEMFG